MRIKLITIGCSIFWGCLSSPVLMNIDSSIIRPYRAAFLLSVLTSVISLWANKSFGSTSNNKVVEFLSLLILTFVVCVVILLLFQFHMVRFG